MTSRLPTTAVALTYLVLRKNLFAYFLDKHVVSFFVPAFKVAA